MFFSKLSISFEKKKALSLDRVLLSVMVSRCFPPILVLLSYVVRTMLLNLKTIKAMMQKKKGDERNEKD